MRLTFVLAVTLIAAVPTVADADSRVDSAPTLEEAIAQAKKYNKVLIADFYTTWCGPCKVFDKRVLAAPAVKAALKEVHFVKWNAESGHGITAAKKLGVRGYPTVMAIAPDGEVIGRGGTGKKSFLSFLRTSTESILSESEIQKRLAQDPKNANILLSAARWHRNHGNRTQAYRLFAKARRADPGNQLGVAADAGWDEMQLRRFHRVRRRIGVQMAWFARRFPGDPRAQSALVAAVRSGALNHSQAEKVARGLIKRSKASALNGLVYTLLAANTLEAAEQCARKQLSHAPQDANSYDTLAEVLHMRGAHDDAIAMNQKALAMGPGHKMLAGFKSNRERFARRLKDELDQGVIDTRERVDSRLRDVPGHDPSFRKPEHALKKKVSRTQKALVELRVFHRAIGSRLREVGKKCHSPKNKLKEAWVRVALNAEGGRPTRVWVFEPGIDRRLKRCLKRELIQSEFPKAYDKKRTHTGAVRFPKARAKPRVKATKIAPKKP